MRKIYLVMRQEIINTYTRRSYLAFAFGIPLLAILIFAGVKYFQGRQTDQDRSVNPSSGSQSKYDLAVEGYVDQSGVIQSIPDQVMADRILAYPNEQKAQLAMKEGEITAYYLIPQDYLKNGRLYYVYPNTKSYLAGGQAWVMRWILMVNLLDQNLELSDCIWSPVWVMQETNLSAKEQATQGTGEDCSRPGSACRSNKLVRSIPWIMVVLLFGSLMVSSSMLFNSVGIEKENRTIELLLMSMNARQLLVGKTLALGMAGLLQVTIWLGVTFILFNQGGSMMGLTDKFSIPLDILLWSLLLFLGGFVLYASLMAGLGAMVHTMKESGIANIVVMFPLSFGYLIGLYAPIAQATQTSFPVIFSLVPFTAPVVMVMRLVDGTVPLWQVLLSIGLVYLTAYLTLRMVAAMFRAQNLLSGQPFSMMRYLRALAGR